MHYVYGPIPSQRLGQSLGIDPIPFKTCNWNCVYCQLGRTSPLINERREYVPPSAILTEVRTLLEAHRPGTIDWISIVGSGEPTLYASIGQLIREIKAITNIPLAVITNGSLLYLPTVRTDLLPADAVMPTLVAGNAQLYRALVRPWPRLTFERLLEGLSAFRKIYTGKFWIEVMLIKDLNDSTTALRELASVLRWIGPDAIHITQPTRPAAEPWVEPPDDAGLQRAREILGPIAQVVHPTTGNVDLSTDQELVNSVEAVITRHPMCEADLAHALGHWSPEQIAGALTELAASGRAQVIVRDGKRFWSIVKARYGMNI